MGFGQNDHCTVLDRLVAAVRFSTREPKSFFLCTPLQQKREIALADQHDLAHPFGRLFATKCAEHLFVANHVADRSAEVEVTALADLLDALWCYQIVRVVVVNALHHNEALFDQPFENCIGETDAHPERFGDRPLADVLCVARPALVKVCQHRYVSLVFDRAERFVCFRSRHYHVDKAGS